MHQEKAIGWELLQESPFQKKESIIIAHHQVVKRSFMTSQANRHHPPRQSDQVTSQDADRRPLMTFLSWQRKLHFLEVFDTPWSCKLTIRIKGSTITRTVISKGGEERREAFRSSTRSHRKSSIEKLGEVRVSRSSKTGFTIEVPSYVLDYIHGDIIYVPIWILLVWLLVWVNVKPLEGTINSPFSNEKIELNNRYK